MMLCDLGEARQVKVFEIDWILLIVNVVKETPLVIEVFELPTPQNNVDDFQSRWRCF